VEEVLAVVGNTPILASDVALAELVQLVPAADNEPSAVYASRLLEARIRLELQFRDLEDSAILRRLDFDHQKILAALAAKTGNVDDLASRLASRGLAWSDLEELSLRLAATNAYVEQRLRPQVAVSLAEVEAAYRDELAIQVAAAGEPLPELTEVSDQLHRLLVERKLNAEIERWLEEARDRQDLTRFVR
jgi:hypothetical protein